MSHHLDTPLAAKPGRLLIDGLLTGDAARDDAADAPEAMLSLVTNAAVPAGLTPSTNSQRRKDSFPYVVKA